jgi:hypothetical protein
MDLYGSGRAHLGGTEPPVETSETTTGLDHGLSDPIESRNRPPGLFAFLPGETVWYFPPSSPLSNTTAPRHRKSKRALDIESTSTTQPAGYPVSIDDLYTDATVVVFFLYDPRQPHSQRIKTLLKELQQSTDDSNDDSTTPWLRIVAVAQTSDDCNDIHMDAAHATFVQHTGWYGTHATPSLNLVCGWTQVPALAVLDRQGRKCSVAHEGWALEWLSAITIRERWMQGQSALSTTQQVLVSTVVYPACSVM